MTKHKKGKKQVVVAKQLKPDNYIEKNARKFPLVSCLISTQWKEQGMAVIYVSRRRANGNLIVGNYLVDVFCLGLKNTSYIYDISDSDFDEFVSDYKEKAQLEFEVISSDMAHNVIYGAIEYAEDLGFQPNKAFKVTEFILEPVESIPYIDVEFGRNGRPFYVAGPHDDSLRIVNILSEKLGDDGFDFYDSSDGDDEYADYGDASDEDDASDDEIDFEEVGKEYTKRIEQSYASRRYDSIFDVDDDDIIDFSEAEYKRESAGFEQNSLPFRIDTYLTSVYNELTDAGKKQLDKQIENKAYERFATFLRATAAKDATDDEAKKILESEETKDRVNYALYSFQDFLTTKKAKRASLKDFVLSAYLRLA